MTQHSKCRHSPGGSRPNDHHKTVAGRSTYSYEWATEPPKCEGRVGEEGVGIGDVRYGTMVERDRMDNWEYYHRQR